jgi:hypothetical protein
VASDHLLGTGAKLVGDGHVLWPSLAIRRNHTMMDAFTVGMQTLVLILFAKTFVRTPIGMHRSLIALLKTFISFMPVLLITSLATDAWTEDWMSFTVLAFELSFVAVVIVSALKAFLLRIGVDN